MYLSVATKTLSISEEAYHNLIHLKKEGESFSQLIIRLTSKKGDPETILETIQFLQTQNEEELDDLADNIEEVYKIRKSRKLRYVNL